MSNDTHDAAAPLEPFDRLKSLLREMFQLDRGDLDFGLYRIMAMKAGEIEEFLDRDLFPQVKTVLAGVADEEQAALEEALAEAREQARQLGVDPDDAPKVRELRDELAKAKADADAEAAVYGHLATFFARYYREGDFMSLRRYAGGGRTTYLIPYDGEEVKLHWANADQYYIKTTENYAAYAFTAGEGVTTRRVCFEIAAADTEKDNVKAATDKQRRFVLAQGDNAFTHDGADLVVRFEHRPLTDAEKKMWPGNGARQQERIDEASAARVLGALDGDWRTLLAAPAPTAADPERTLLAGHVARYTAKNSFDYFIHKDLGGFLRRELDLYLKTEVLNLDDLAAGDADRLRRALARMRAVRHVAEKIVAFLAQLEDFQKRLWLKKKFVLKTQWCVTLDRVPEAFYSKIAANEAQRREWVELFAIDEIAGDLGNGGVGYGEPLSAAFLKANPYLVLDTRHFDTDFRERLLAALSDAGPLDEKTDGLLIHGENFQALNLLQARYAGEVKCVYIDPPYNTGGDGFIYKDQYKHSTWLAMVKDRLSTARSLLSTDGILFSSIDDIEQPLLRLILDSEFGAANRIANMVWKGATDNNPTRIAIEHEYLVWYAREIANVSPVWKSTFIDAKNLLLDEWERLRKKHNKVLDIQHWYRKFIKDNREILSPLTHYDRIDEDGPYTGGRKVHNPGKEGYRYDVIHPKTGKPCVQPARGYRFPLETMKKLLDGDKVIFGEDENQIIQIKEYLSDYDGGLKGLVELDGRVGANVLESLFGSREMFKNPKPVELLVNLFGFVAASNHLILDFLAGSGTTGHAAIDLNRRNGGNRKYILVEMGDHFDTVMLPRLKKVAYSPDWKAGKPVARDKGVSHLIRYVRLESYEDTLDGLVLTPPSGELLAANDRDLIEDYRLRYALEAETASSPCLLGRDFPDPFTCTLSVVRDGARRETPADLPETFNFLIGLRVESRRRLDGVLAIAGKDAQGQRCLILWRNLQATDNRALNRWFAEHRARLPTPLNLVYVNGDHTLNAIRLEGETWTAETIEPLFRELMFGADER